MRKIYNYSVYESDGEFIKVVLKGEDGRAFYRNVVRKNDKNGQLKMIRELQNMGFFNL